MDLNGCLNSINKIPFKITDNNVNSRYNNNVMLVESVEIME